MRRSSSLPPTPDRCRPEQLAQPPERLKFLQDGHLAWPVSGITARSVRLASQALPSATIAKSVI
jgi:hypothetical protein